MKLIALERLVRLSRPGALISEQPAASGESLGTVPSREKPPTRKASIVRFAFSRLGSLVLELVVGQYFMDVTALCNAWVDRVLFGVAKVDVSDKSEEGGGSSPQSNVAVVHRVLRREQWSRLGPAIRRRLLQLKSWMLLRITMRVTTHFFRRLLHIVLRRPGVELVEDELTTA